MSYNACHSLPTCCVCSLCCPWALLPIAFIFCPTLFVLVHNCLVQVPGMVLTVCIAQMQSARFMTYSQGQSMIVTVIILVGSVNALSYNVVHYLMIQMTSAVTTTVLGEVKIIGLLVLSVLLLGKLCSKVSVCIRHPLHVTAEECLTSSGGVPGLSEGLVLSLLL